MTEETAQMHEDYDLAADKAVKIFLIAFVLIIAVTLATSALYQGMRHHNAERHIKPLVTQHYDYWNREQK